MTCCFDDKMIANKVSSPWPKMIQVEMMSAGETITLVAVVVADDALPIPTPSPAQLHRCRSINWD